MKSGQHAISWCYLTCLLIETFNKQVLLFFWVFFSNKYDIYFTIFLNSF